MIYIQHDRKWLNQHTDRKHRPVKPRAGRPISVADTTKLPFQRMMSSTMPLVDAIATELRDDGGHDELTLFHTARRLLEEAYAVVEHTPVVVDPLLDTEVER